MIWHGKNFRGFLNKASQVLFNKTGTTLNSTNVQDAICEINSNLSKHTTSSNTRVSLTTSDYTITSDGYVEVEAKGDNSYVIVLINDRCFLSTKGITVGGSDLWQGNSVFVRKGMTTKITNSSGNYSAYFYPLE